MDDVFKLLLTFILLSGLIFVFSLRMEPPHEVSFHKGDMVYVLPDSTEAIIESIIWQTSKEKINGEKRRVVVGYITHVQYTDKNGVIRRQKVSHATLIKIPTNHK